MTSRATQVAILQHAIRWSSNVLVEVSSNHSAALTVNGRQHLHDAIRSLENMRLEFLHPEKECTKP